MKMKNRFFSLCFFLFCLLSLSSCLNSKRIDKTITKYYNDNPIPRKVKPVENISISSPLSTGGPPSATTGKTYNWLPLVVYLEFDYAMTCTLNPEHAITVYSNALYKYASKKLSKTLGGKQLKISIEKVPQQFLVLDEAHMIFLGIAAISWDKITISSISNMLAVQYQVLENGKEIRSGSLTATMPDYKVRMKRPTVTKDDIGDFVTNYEKNISVLSQRMADQLERELQLVNQ